MLLHPIVCNVELLPVNNYGRLDAVFRLLVIFELLNHKIAIVVENCCMLFNLWFRRFDDFHLEIRKVLIELFVTDIPVRFTKGTVDRYECAFPSSAIGWAARIVVVPLILWSKGNLFVSDGQGFPLVE